MKNAYEIRLEVLQMAHSDLFHKYNEKTAVTRILAERNGDSKAMEEVVEKQFPKADDILKRAEELYVFVSEKN